MEKEGYLKKKSPKTQGKKVMDIWQKRYFVLTDGKLMYFKTDKQAAMSNSVPLKVHRVCVCVEGGVGSWVGATSLRIQR